MDQQLLLFFSILAPFFIFLIRKLFKKPNSSAPKLPPGPWKLPVIGSIHHLLHPLPHHRLRDLAKIYGPIMHLKLGEVPAVVISSPEAAKLVMKTHDLHFADRPFVLAVGVVSYNFQDIGGAPYGEHWRQLRKICTLELLTMKRVQSFRSIREEEVKKTIESIASKAGSPVNISQIIAYATYDIISRAAFGKVWKGEDVFVPAVQKLIQAASGFNVADIYPSVKFLHVISGVKSSIERLHKGIDVILEDVLNQHKAARKVRNKKIGEEEKVEDLVDVLLNFQDDENIQFSLTDQCIKAVIMDMFTAGSETSSMTVEWALAELMKNPKVLKRAQEEVRQAFSIKGGVAEEGLQDLNYLKMVIKETLRLHAPLPLLLPRQCRQDCQINGYDIPAKTRVVVNAWAIGRDPEYWVDAEKFFPERFSSSNVDYKGNNFEFIPFGAGRRMCPGLSFGIADVELPLAMLLYHFDWELPSGMKPENLDMTECSGAGRRKDDLFLIPTPFLPTSIN